MAVTRRYRETPATRVHAAKPNQGPKTLPEGMSKKQWKKHQKLAKLKAKSKKAKEEVQDSKGSVWHGGDDGGLAECATVTTRMGDATMHGIPSPGHTSPTSVSVCHQHAELAGTDERNDNAISSSAKLPRIDANVAADTMRTAEDFQEEADHSITDSLQEDIAVFEARIKDKLAQFYAAPRESQETRPIWNPHGGCWQLYSTEFYKIWKSANANDQNLLTGLKFLPHEASHSGLARMRVTAAVILAQLNYQTDIFGMPQFSSRLSMMLDSWAELDTDSTQPFDTDIMFFGDGYLTLRVSEEVAMRAVKGVQGWGPAKLGSKGGMMFYGRHVVLDRRV